MSIRLLPSPGRSGLLRALSALLVVLSLFLTPATPAQAAPILWLPTPVGQRWKIVQGYECGTHNSGYERLSLDLVNVDGATHGAPIRAAATGRVFAWTPQSGTLILSHGDGFYTQYTHLASVVSTSYGTLIPRGAVLGTAGSTGSPEAGPHLHLTAFQADGSWASNRRAVAFAFAEGYDLPEIGGCNQHGGKILVAKEPPKDLPEGIVFSSEAEPEQWYRDSVEIEFTGQGIVGGHSIAWNQEPAANRPQRASTTEAEVQSPADSEGSYTLFVRGWDADGQQTVASFGPLKVDRTAPTAPALLTSELQVVAESKATLAWEPATDAASGVAGYRLYIGPDPLGTSEWFVPAPTTELPPLAVGQYLLRVQPIDHAGNQGEWLTLGTIHAR
jgi:hypothetical protein